MTAPGNDHLYLLLTLALVLSSCYAVGRIHQWHRHGLERDEAYHAGFDRASRSIIGMLTDRDDRSGAGSGSTTPPHAWRGEGAERAHHAGNQRALYPAPHRKTGRRRA